MKYLRIRNFERFQHYKDRKPPWIKLYRDLWNEPRFFELSESDRYFLISFFVIASQNDNKIPANEHWLKREMATRRAVPIDVLVDSNWLEWKEDAEETASTLLATSVHDDSIMLVLPRERDREENTPRISREYSAAFQDFWEASSKRGSKWEANLIWQKIPEDVRETAKAAMIQAIRTEWASIEERFIPHVVKWLRGRRWETVGESAKKARGAVY